MADLLKQENAAKLKAILTYHVLPKEMKAADVAGADSLSSLLGQGLKVSRQGGKVMLGEATVQKADIEASNGVIHSIDKVLMPDLSRIGDIPGSVEDITVPGT